MCMNNASESHQENKLRKSTESTVHFIDWQEEIDWLIAMIDTRDLDWLIAMIEQ